MPPLKILIAEDDKVTQKLYNQGLPESLCEKQFAINGEEALEYYDKWHPDIILLDIYMPIMNGFEALKYIRQQYKDSKTTVIIVTSSSEKDDIVVCATLGIQGYIVKPIKTKELAKTILNYHKAWLHKRKETEAVS